MEKNQYYLPLNLPDIKDQILPEYVEELLNYRTNEPAEHQAFMAFADKTPPALATELFSQLGLTICNRKMTLFTTTPKEIQAIHLDGDPADVWGFRPFGINWVWGGITIMEWFQRKQETLPPATYWLESRYIPFAPSEVSLAQRSTLTGATLVNIRHPHRVMNVSNQRRFCFSMCSEENLSWDEITDLCYKHGLVRE